MKFSYQAKTKDGNPESGTIEASSREGALEVLQKYDLYPVSVEAKKNFLSEEDIPFLSEVSKEDIILFTRQMSILTRSNLPITESLETIANQAESNSLKEKIFKMVGSIEGGGSLSGSFEQFPEIFSPFYIGMLKAGERSGNIPESFEYLASYMEKNRELMSQLRGALVYPVFVSVIFVFLLVLMSVFIVPSFEQVFTDLGVELPFSTRVVMGLSSAITTWWWLIIAVLVAGVVGLNYLFKEEEVKAWLDEMVLKIPVVGKVLKKIYLARISLNISTLIAGGVSISEVLETTSELVGNTVYKEIMLKTREGVRAGKKMTSVFSLYPEYFTHLFLQMISSGERTGSLDKTLENVVQYYDKEVERSLGQLLKFIEPLLIVILGGMIAFMSASLFLPLFKGGALGA